MALSSPVDRFRSAAEVITPARMVVLLYERLQRDLEEAERALSSGDRYDAHRALLHAQEIVSALDGALDAQVWSEATRLSAVYRFVGERLVAANLGQDVAAVRDCRTVIDPLLETWREAWSQNAAGTRPAPPSPTAPRLPVDVAG